MIEIKNGEYYDLGRKTFRLLLIRRISATIILIIAVLLLEIMHPLIISNFKSASNFNIDAIFYPALDMIIMLAIISAIIGFVLARIEHKVSKIMLDDSSLKIIKGVLNKEEIRLPYRRIQSVEIKQQLFHRLMGVSRLVISTTNDIDSPNNTEAQNESDDEVISVIDYDLAQAIADKLTNRVEIERMQVQQIIHTEPELRK
jgi:uncharacterized membrane protein YdbT with pleckstrin-like domain